MTYPEIVKRARELAKTFNERYVVFMSPSGEYDWCPQELYEQRIKTTPMIRLLLILPSGKIVQ